MKNRTSRRVIAVGTGMVFVSACFSYVPAEMGTVPEGEDVRVYLTRAGMEELPELASEGGPFVSGTLMSADADEMMVRVPVAVRREGFFMGTLGQDVGIPTSQVIQLERRELNKVGTGLLVGGTAGLAVLVVTMIITDGRRGEAPPPPGPEEIRIPLFSIPAFQ